MDLKKETFGTKVLENCKSASELTQMDRSLFELIEKNQKELKKYQDRVNNLMELVNEWYDSPEKFIEKYSKNSKPKKLLNKVQNDPFLKSLLNRFE